MDSLEERLFKLLEKKVKAVDYKVTSTCNRILGDTKSQAESMTKNRTTVSSNKSQLSTLQKLVMNFINGQGNKPGSKVIRA